MPATKETAMLLRFCKKGYEAEIEPPLERLCLGVSSLSGLDLSEGSHMTDEELCHDAEFIRDVTSILREILTSGRLPGEHGQTALRDAQMIVDICENFNNEFFEALARIMLRHAVITRSRRAFS